jgi:TPR repeat protein/nucleoid-associated protein YgaU
MIFRQFGRLSLVTVMVLVASPAGAQNSGPVDLAAATARAEAGDAEAANLLGNLYTNAQGVPRDFAAALKWYQLAADKGHAPGQFNLGLAYELGRGVAADEQQALRHYLRAAEQGFPAAQFNVGNMYATGRGAKQDMFEANLWFKQAADRGVVEAQFNLGLAYEEGRGVKKDEAQAVKWYRLAAERGFARAQYNLGLLLEDGKGAEKNLNAAAALYQQAALAGHSPAMTNLGLMYSQGRGGLSKDPVLAYAWLSLAVETGSAPAARDFVGEELTAEQKDGATALVGDLKRRIARATGQPLPAATRGDPGPTAPGGAPSRELADALAEARAANARFAEVNQRLEVEKTQLEQKLAQEAAAARTLVENLRKQGERLQAQMQEAIGDKAAAENNVTGLSAQLRDTQSELARAKQGAATTAVPAEFTAQLETAQARARQLQADKDAAAQEAAALTRQLAGAQEEVSRLRAAAAAQPAIDTPKFEAEISELKGANQRLAAANAKLEQDLQSARAQPPVSAAVGAAKTPATDAEKDNMIRALQRDNQRLNDDVKRSTRELLALNQQLRAANRKAPGGDSAPPPANDAAAKELADLQGEYSKLQDRLADARGQAKQLQTELDAARESASGSNALQEQVRKLEAELQSARAASAGTADLGAQITALRSELTETRTQRQQAEADLALAAQRVRSLEDELSTARKAPVPAANNAVQERELAEAAELAGRLRTEMTRVQAENSALAAQVESAREDIATIKARLADAQSGAQEAAKLREQVAELTGALARRDTELADARSAAARRPAADPQELEQLRAQAGRVAALTAEAGELRAANERLQKEKNELEASSRSKSAAREMRAALAQVEDLQGKLAEANRRAEGNAREATDLTEANRKLKQELEAARVPRISASNPADRRELETARAQIEDLQGQVAQLQAAAATRGDDPKLKSDLAEAVRAQERSAATIAELTGANESLQKDLANAQKSLAAALAAQNQAVDASKGEAYQLEIQTLTNRVKQLEASLEEGQGGAAKEISTLAAQLAKTRETNRALVEANRALLQTKEAEKSFEADELAQARQKLQEATAAQATLADANQKLGAELAAAKRDLEQAQGQAAQSTALTDENRAVRARLAEFERAAETAGGTVAELTGANTKLEQERDDLRAQVDRLQADNIRLTQDLRGATQVSNAVNAQLASLRRDVENARAANATLVESTAAQERERAALLAQLREENRALTVRLGQAQGVLDQIASAARLGTPASAIASTGASSPRPVTVNPTPVEAAPRIHVVAEGDSLSRVSLRYYGTAARWQEIFEANRDVLQGANALRVGQQLRIP